VRFAFIIRLAMVNSPELRQFFMPIRHLIIVSSLLFSLVSCVSIGEIPTQQQIAAVIPGQTSEAQALLLLGKPERTQEENGRRLHHWVNIRVDGANSLVFCQNFELLAIHNGIVQKKNFWNSALHKSGFIVTETTALEGVLQPSVSALSSGIKGAEAEMRLGRPLSRELRVDGGLDRTWVSSVKNLYLMTNVKPSQVIGHFSADGDRLLSAEKKR
jgi:hypothetical protein